MLSQQNHNQITSHYLPKAPVVSDRDKFILSFCQNKRVLHLGCIGSVDSFMRGTALHYRIIRSAQKVVGVDIDREAIDYLRKQGIEELLCMDVQEPGAFNDLEKFGLFDLIIAGEILEHLANPGIFLENISQLMDKENTVLLLTIPNAFSLRSFFSVLIGRKELVRGDHNYYFSFVTMGSLLNSHGLMVSNVYTYSNLRAGQNKLKGVLKKIVNKSILAYSPFLAEGLIVLSHKK